SCTASDSNCKAICHIDLHPYMQQAWEKAVIKILLFLWVTPAAGCLKWGVQYTTLWRPKREKLPCYCGRGPGEIKPHWIGRCLRRTAKSAGGPPPNSAASEAATLCRPQLSCMRPT